MFSEKKQWFLVFSSLKHRFQLLKGGGHILKMFAVEMTEKYSRHQKLSNVIFI